MSWTKTKKTVLECLSGGRFLHYQRGDIDVKNLLSTGEISTKDVIELLKRARGNEHTESPHHLDRTIVVNIVKRRSWYIKWYFLEPDVVFISVHEED